MLETATRAKAAAEKIIFFIENPPNLFDSKSLVLLTPWSLVKSVSPLTPAFPFNLSVTLDLVY